MRWFWTIQVCIGAAALAGSFALSSGCGGTVATGTGTDTGVDTANYTCTSTDDTCLGGGPCCDLQICAAAHCQSECVDTCGFYSPGPGCTGCRQAACAAENAACK